jgi:hypothetical protein
MAIMREENILPNVVTYNTLINKAPDYDTASEWFDSMRKEDMLPDASIYSVLINKATDFDTAKSLVDMMREEDVLPDIGIYKTLHILIEDIPSPDNTIAKAWVDKMQREVNYILLFFNAPDYETAKALMDIMREENILPDIYFYNILINKAPDYETAKALMDIMREENILPDTITYNTINKFFIKAPEGQGKEYPAP